MMPTVEFQITVDRRELASIRAGLRLLQWVNGPDGRNIPYPLAIELGHICSDAGKVYPLGDADVVELVRRLA